MDTRLIEKQPSLCQLYILPNNISDDESISVYSSSTSKRTRGKDKIFIFDTVYESKTEAVDQLNKEKIWPHMKTVYSKRLKTSKCNFRCNQVRYRE